MPAGREAELAQEGWVRKFAAEASKARECAQVYEELGFEVRLEPEEGSCPPEGECRACLKSDGRLYLAVYARRNPSANLAAEAAGAREGQGKSR